MSQKKLYVIFSATPLKIGSIIRTVTGEKYNHVSLSFDGKLEKMYSYARYFKKAPLYGGFVLENPSRYKNRGKRAEIFVCAVPITDIEYCLIKKRLKYMTENPEKHVYNFYSAAFSLFERRVFVPNCYTCVEFAAEILSMVLPQIKADRFYSVETLRRVLSQYCLYCGPFPNIPKKSDGLKYDIDIPFYDICRLSLKSEVDLFKAFAARKNKS